jgi:hypothetical protein
VTLRQHTSDGNNLGMVPQLLLDFIGTWIVPLLRITTSVENIIGRQPAGHVRA